LDDIARLHGSCGLHASLPDADPPLSVVDPEVDELELSANMEDANLDRTTAKVLEGIDGHGLAPLVDAVLA
jgi:hypothetical protein